MAAKGSPKKQSSEASQGKLVRGISAVSVVAAVLLGISANVLASRFYERWDFTSRGLYTLSDVTTETLGSLAEPVEVIVFLSASDPLTVSVRHMLAAYGAKTTKLRPRYVDPDRDPAEFMALQQRYGIVAGKTEDGRVVTDASIVIAKGDRHWFITQDELVAYDENDGRAQPRLEQALTEGLRNVQVSDRVTVCFSTGHQEMSMDDGGPTGVAELRYRLEKNNYDVEAVDLALPKLNRSLEDCALVIVAGPELRFSEEAAKRLTRYVQSGGATFLLVNPILDEENRISTTGLEGIARLAGVELATDFVVERDDKARLPSGLGESFFAAPREHAVTRGLIRGDEARFRVLVSAAQSLRVVEGQRAQPLLVSSPEAFSVQDIRPFVDQGKPVEKSASDAGGPLVLAVAAELDKPKASKAPRGHRMVIVGTANPIWGRSFREPTLLGSRLFVESAVSWLVARPALVSVPEKASHDVGLSLTEESLRDVMLYVLVYMPGAAILLGGFVMLRRRSREKQSRAEHETARKKKERAKDESDPEEPPDSEDDP